MTTPETLEARLEEDDILSGMLPRFTFYVGTPREPIAWPEAASKSGTARLAADLQDIHCPTSRETLITTGELTLRATCWQLEQLNRGGSRNGLPGTHYSPVSGRCAKNPNLILGAIE